MLSTFGLLIRLAGLLLGIPLYDTFHPCDSLAGALAIVSSSSPMAQVGEIAAILILIVTIGELIRHLFHLLRGPAIVARLRHMLGNWFKRRQPAHVVVPKPTIALPPKQPKAHRRRPTGNKTQARHGDTNRKRKA